MTGEDRLIPIRKVAKHLGVKRRTIYNWIKEGKHFDMTGIVKTSAGYSVKYKELKRVYKSFEKTE